jgi:hypothetical protein
MKKFDFISDPGHGWLKVPHALLAELGIADKITSYSYSRDAFAYLEEDCDYSTFLAAMRAAGREFSIRERNSPHRPSRVRNYATYRPRITLEQAIIRNPLAKALHDSGHLIFIEVK